MAHTFLFQPAIWSAAGTFWRADGELLEASGRVEITHRPECWLLSGSLKVMGSPPCEFVHAYLIEPPKREGGGTTWSSENATLGKLQGTYTVIGSCIISVYGCRESGYHGAEHFEQLDAGTYRAAGVLLLEDRCLSSWQTLLRITPSPGRSSPDSPG